MLIGSLAANRSQSVVAEDAGAVVTPLVGANPRGAAATRVDGAEAPAQTFAVEFSGAGYAPPHFHDVDQYQIFYSGAGKIGRHEIVDGVVAVHYADRYVSYGPILPHEVAGLAYITVRMTFDSGMHVMPEDRRMRLERGGRQVVEHVVPSRAPTEPEVLIQRAADGLFAAVLRIGPGQDVVDVPAATVSQQLIVIHGSIEYRGEQHACPTTVVLRAGERPACIAGGPDGAVLLSLHFPSPDRAMAEDGQRPAVARDLEP